MKKSLLALAVIAILGISTSHAQFFQMGLKLQYSTTSIDDMINDLEN